MPRTSSRSSAMARLASSWAWPTSSAVSAGSSPRSIRCARQPEVHGDGHQPLLSAVVQVPLDATALRFRGVHRGFPALGQLLDPLLQLHRPARAQQGPDERPVDGRQTPHHMRGDEQDDQPGDADDQAVDGSFHHAEVEPAGVRAQSPAIQRERDAGQADRPQHDGGDERHDPEREQQQAEGERLPGCRVGDERLDSRPQPTGRGEGSERGRDVDVQQQPGPAPLHPAERPAEQEQQQQDRDADQRDRACRHRPTGRSR